MSEPYQIKQKRVLVDVLNGILLQGFADVKARWLSSGDIEYVKHFIRTLEHKIKKYEMLYKLRSDASDKLEEPVQEVKSSKFEDSIKKSLPGSKE